MSVQATYKNKELQEYYWCQDGKLHRLDRPAYIDEKNKIYVWYQDGKRHRGEGPAYIDEKYKLYRWFIHGVNKTEEITTWLQDNEIDWRNMSVEEKVLLKVVFG